MFCCQLFVLIFYCYMLYTLLYFYYISHTSLPIRILNPFANYVVCFRFSYWLCALAVTVRANRKFTHNTIHNYTHSRYVRTHSITRVYERWKFFLTTFTVSRFFGFHSLIWHTFWSVFMPFSLHPLTLVIVLHYFNSFIN